MICLFQLIQMLPPSATQFEHLEILNRLEQMYASSFAKGYFGKKKQALIDAELGLNAEQIAAVDNIDFTEGNFTKDQIENIRTAIKGIESALVIKNPAEVAQLPMLNQDFWHLSYSLSAEDFTQFTQRLLTLREQVPAVEGSQHLSELLKLLCKQRTIEAFNQMYFRNQNEGIAHESLLKKFFIFAQDIKPLGKSRGVLSSQTIEDILAMLTLNGELSYILSVNFTRDINILLSFLESFTSRFPHIQNHLLTILSKIPDKNTEQYSKNMMGLLKGLKSIDVLFTDSKQDQLDLYTIFAQCSKDPIHFLATWKIIQKVPGNSQQKFLLGLVINLLATNQSLEGLSTFINHFKTHSDSCMIMRAPYPSLEQLNAWFIAGNFEDAYKDYTFHPFGERRSDFAFNLSEYAIQAPLFQGKDEDIFIPALGKEIGQELQRCQSLDLESLRQEFANLSGNRSLNNQQKLRLLCIATEVLARSSSQWDDSIPAKRISQEMNTTQIMASYARLINPSGRHISEVATGEGKSRQNMVLAGCMAAIGYTVDFMTSDMQLAERDFLSYQSFFTNLGIRTSLIDLNTPQALYQRGGVNFSDNTQLLLLRNKSDIDLEPYAFMEEDPTKRCLLLDEVDQFIHDKAMESFNFAQASEKLKNFIWVYPLLVKFVRKIQAENPEALLLPASLTDQFIQFIRINDTNELHLANIASLHAKESLQIATWIQSAHTALQMVKNKHYSVTPDDEAQLVRMRDGEGMLRYSRRVYVLNNGRPVYGSTYANGVHQCLCVIENEASENKEAFVIPYENQTQRSSYASTFIEKYNQGCIFGMSGTARSEGPLADPAINYLNFDYLIVPRHKPLRLETKPTWAAKDKTQQVAFLKRLLQEKLSKISKDPFLIICKNDQESAFIYDAISTDPELKDLFTKCTRISAHSSKEDELQAIAEAGDPGKVTISTVGMFGRGVDIQVNNNLSLYVIAAYVPKLEDTRQIMGRTARCGKNGTFRMIPDLSDPDLPLNGKTYNIHNEVIMAQKNLALQAIFEEEVSAVYADFEEKITQHFLAQYKTITLTMKGQYLTKWQEFLKELQNDWHFKKAEMLAALDMQEEERFTHLFTEFTLNWEDAAEKLFSAKMDQFDAKIHTVTTAINHHRGFFKPERKALIVQDSYDPAHDGQACIYSSLFVQLGAVLRGERAVFADYHAWKEGRGELFPDLMAILNGERPLFANLLATIERLIEVFRAWWNRTSSSSQAVENMDVDMGDESMQEAPITSM